MYTNAPATARRFARDLNATPTTLLQRHGLSGQTDSQMKALRGLISKTPRWVAAKASKAEEEEREEKSRYPSISHHSGGGANNVRVLSWLEQGGMSRDDEYQGRMKKLHVRTTTIIHNDRYG